MVFGLGFGTVYWEQIWRWERSILLGKYCSLLPFSLSLLDFISFEPHSLRKVGFITMFVLA